VLCCPRLAGRRGLELQQIIADRCGAGLVAEAAVYYVALGARLVQAGTWCSDVDVLQALVAQFE